jgi:hypothetical protein
VTGGSNGARRRPGAQRGDDLHAIHLGKLVVEHDEVGAQGLGGADRGATVEHLLDVVAARLQERLDAQREILLVVDDQDRALRFERGRGRRGPIADDVEQGRGGGNAFRRELRLDLELELAVEAPHGQPRLVVREVRLDLHLVVGIDAEDELAAHEVLVQHELHERVVAIAEP